ncbi:type IV secretion system protein [Lysobacter sp. CA199]|uniref:type IV secretion system protein n=1 Tax=Lysobacter sp. CA199 TaxID=3455608 RepID=UPI003F8D3221
MDILSLDGIFSFVTPKAQGGVLDFAFFKLINDYFSEEITTFGFKLMQRMMTWVGGLALTLATLYFLVAGYRVATGHSREPMMGLVTNSLKVVLILFVATGMTFGNVNIYNLLTTGLDTEIHETISGETGKTSVAAIDQNLAYMQIAMSAIDAVQVVDGDDETREQKGRALLMAGFGTASVPMTVGALTLMYRFGIAFFVGLAPLFILCLMFEQTKELFKKWLMSGIATYFAMAALSVMSAIALKFMSKVAVAFWVSKALNGILGLEPEGMTSLAIQQGGIGLIVTVLLISVPPMVGTFFNGALGSFSTYTAFNPTPATSPGPQGQPPGSYAPPATHTKGTSENQRLPGSSYDSGARYSTGASLDAPDPNEIKKK